MNNLLKTFALAGLLITSSISVFAIDKEKETLNKSVVENIVDEYINSTVKGNTIFIDELFSENFTQKFNTKSNQAPVSKKEYIKYIKSNKGTTYNCDVDYQIIEKSGNYSLSKVTLDFKNFKRTDFLTMEKDKNGWKITEVNSVFKAK